MALFVSGMARPLIQVQLMIISTFTSNPKRKFTLRPLLEVLLILFGLTLEINSGLFRMLSEEHGSMKKAQTLGLK